jgi:hypothetical protein
LEASDAGIFILVLASVKKV